jgi:hypothetical protein
VGLLLFWRQLSSQNSPTFSGSHDFLQTALTFAQLKIGLVVYLKILIRGNPNFQLIEKNIIYFTTKPVGNRYISTAKEIKRGTRRC